MPLPVTNKHFTKPPTEQQLLAFIKRLGYDEDPKEIMTSIPTFVATRLLQPRRAILSVLNRCLTGIDISWDRARFLVLQILWGIVHSANFDYALLNWDEFKCQVLDRIIPRRSDAKMHNKGQYSPISMLINIIDGKFKFIMEIPDTMINDAIKHSARYEFYRNKKNESEKGNAKEEVEEKHVSPIRIGKGKGYMCIGNQEVNVSNKPKKAVVLRKLRTIIVADNIVEQETRQVKKDVEEGYAAEKGLKLKGVAPEDPAVKSRLALRKGSKESRREHVRIEMQAGRGEGSSVAQEENYDLVVTCSSIKDYTNLPNDPSKQELTDLLSKPMYTDAQTTLVEANPEGNPEEVFADDAGHHISSPPANTTHNPITNPQQSSIQEKAKNLMAKAKQNKRKSIFKQAVEKKFKEYYHKLEALSSINVPEAIEKIVVAVKFPPDFCALCSIPQLSATPPQDGLYASEKSHDEVYGCLKGGSGNSGGKRLAISMVEEAWLSEKKEV
ncbi:hypothetical protein Tco_0820275 [Tanacetum coccineum]|uniref:Uncharacterized protein n=1 Tax=Tanacetum coccineum TaxID=301880 RepID=A0ABQ5A911_9ASTR